MASPKVVKTKMAAAAIVLVMDSPLPSAPLLKAHEGMEWKGVRMKYLGTKIDTNLELE